MYRAIIKRVVFFLLDAADIIPGNPRKLKRPCGSSVKVWRLALRQPQCQVPQLDSPSLHPGQISKKEHLMGLVGSEFPPASVAEVRGRIMEWGCGPLNQSGHVLTAYRPSPVGSLH